MKKLLVVLLTLASILSYAQHYSMPNLVLKQMGYFYKEGWTPFTGNLVVTGENPSLVTKLKIIGGTEILSEVFRNDKLAQVWKEGVTFLSLRYTI